jgi:hypothetical protein
MKKILAIFMLTLTINAYAAVTVDDLVKRYGKEAIMAVIGSKLKYRFTIEVDGSTQLALAPNINYINVATLTSDIERAEMTTTSMESVLLEKIKQAKKLELRKAEEKRILAEEAVRHLAEEKELDRQRKIEEQNIRVKEAIKLIAENKERELQRKVDEERQAALDESRRQQTEREQSKTRSSYSTKDHTKLNKEDRKAYDSLRSRGWVDSEAKEAAPATRRLCEAIGGSDCR